MNTHVILIAFGLTLFAGLSTGIGSAITLLTRRTSTRFLSMALGFSAGVMIYVSFVELFAEARNSLVSEFGKISGYWITTAAFFGGMLLIAIIDKLVPSFENPHEIRKVEEIDSPKKCSKTRRLFRIGVLSTIAIAIHNFPEGMATFTAAIVNPGLGVAIAIAIAIHNIPEGIAISVPIYNATRNKKKAFWYSFLSGLAEPLGALVAYLILMPFINDTLLGITFAVVAGIMVFISLDELLPAAREYGKPHLAIYGLIAGMAVMAISLLLLA